MKLCPGKRTEELRPFGRVDSGDLFEQTVLLCYEGRELQLRRVLLKLDQPTRNGDTEIALLSNLPSSVASTTLVAHLYRQRWTLESVFQVITETFPQRN